jgi:hypothetical protein
LDAAHAFQVTRIQVECCRDERFAKAGRVNPTKFLTELKRRNVYRAAVAYGVVAWFLTQLTTQVFPFFEIPNSAVRFVVIALAVGFPIAMLLSWLYELTPEGIVRTEDLDPVQARSVQRASGRIAAKDTICKPIDLARFSTRESSILPFESRARHISANARRQASSYGSRHDSCSA